MHGPTSSEKNYEVKGYYPDVIGKRIDGTKLIEEIETESTVTEDECEKQWKPYSKLGYEFILVVPANKVGLAQRFVHRSQLDVTLQTYAISGNSIIFRDLQGNPIV